MEAKRHKTAAAAAVILRLRAEKQLQRSHELEEGGDDEAACLRAEDAVVHAREARLMGHLHFDETDVAVLTDPGPPAALIASIGLATRGSLVRMIDLPVARFGGRLRRDLYAARLDFEESLRMWPGNASDTATCDIVSIPSNA